VTGFGTNSRRTGGVDDRTLTRGAGPRGTTRPHADDSAARLAPGTLLGKRYDILEVLGEGGMGTVYKAKDLELGRLVALKVIRPEMASRPEIIERFKREIVLASQVTHKNVLRIHDLGEAGDIRFLSMSYVEGPNLKTLLEKGGPLPLDRGLALARQIGEALQAAHDAGIVHRDLKPQNVLIGEDDTAYIADFGISRSLAEGGTMTETGTILGTVDYMSPEQARGETPDHRGDIYSFGVMLYEMFTGALPFRASNALSVMMKRLHEDAPSMRRARPELPAWLSAIVGRALQRSPDDRYQNARDLLRDLERQRASRSWRRLARPRYLVPAAALALIAIATLTPLRIPWALRGPSAPVAPRTSLVVLGFQNATGDPRYDWVRAGLPSLIRSEMIEAKRLRLVGEDRAQEVLAALKLPDNVVPSSDTMRRVAGLLGAENVLAGRLVRVVDRLRIEASLQPAGISSSSGLAAAGSSDAISLQVEGAGDRAIFTMVDDLTRQVRSRLGVEGGLLERRRGATELSTGSVEALSLYGEGLALSRTGKDQEAAKRLEGALEKDPQFHVARAVLAETYDRLGYSDKAVAEANKAIAGLGTTSTYEGARIRAVQARLSGNTDAALKAYQELCDVAPNSAEAYLDLATAQEEAGDLQAALKSLARVIALDPKHPNAYYVLGRVNHKLGQGGEALNNFTKALDLNTEMGNDEGRATVFNGLGNTYRYLIGRPEEALKNYQAALEIRQKIDDKRGVAVVLHNLAMIYRDLGRPSEAIKYADDALAINREIGDREGLAVGYSNLGDIYQNVGRPESALEAYRKSLKVAREIDDPAILSRTLANVGYINSVLGHYEEAHVFLKEALSKRREIGDKTEIVRSLIDIGLVEQLQGRYEEAIRYDNEGLGLAKGAGNKAEILVLSANLSNIHEDQGDYAQALALLEDARKLAQEVEGKTFVATCLIYQGSVRRKLGDFEGAEAAFGEGLKLARETKNVPLLAEALANRAALLLQRGQAGQAAPVAKEAVARASEAGDLRLILFARLQAASASGSVRDLEAIAAKSTEAGLAPLGVAAHLALARIHLTAARASDARRHAEEVLSDGGPMRLRDLLFQACGLKGGALLAQHQAASAADQFGAALAYLDAMRQGLSAADLRFFLGRPESVAFGKDAEAAFQNANRGQDVERLRSLLAP